MKFILIGLLSLTLISFQSAEAQLQKTVNPGKIEKQDRKEEKRRTKISKEEAKEREAVHRRVYRSWDKNEKRRDVWTNWHRKKLVPALLSLSKIRKDLFANSLFDNYIERPQVSIPCGQTDRIYRRYDGGCNDLAETLAGAAETRMGRNVKPEAAQQDEANLFFPDPRLVSRELLGRNQFQEVPFLNLHALSWIQFMTHDWFSHGDNEADGAFELTLSNDDPIRQKTKADYLVFQRTRKDRTRTAQDEKLGPTHLNEVTHWWDGSQIYGSTESTARSLRTFQDGQLRLDRTGRKEVLPKNILGVEETGFNRNWWLGLSMLHTLFVKEHNSIALHLKKNYPNMSDEDLYQKARLVNAALMAKIHTVEWTPAILPNTTLYVAMNANWRGLFNGSHKVHPFYELFKQEILFGLVGGKTENSGVPFHLTEEFTSVYRMHSLLPDSVSVESYRSKDVKLAKYDLMDLRETKAGQLMSQYDTTDLMYSFGRQNPGALTLNNIPQSMLNVEVPFSGINQKGIIDIGAMDVFRDRERGVPRYNEFRRQIGLKPITSFEQLTANAEVVSKLKRVYHNNIELLDTMVGSLAEQYRPVNFGFGETAFQVFIAMASRRLMTDRFFTESYNDQTYTSEGLKWVDDNNFKTILLRHYPELKASLFGVKNAFNPWN